jgi:arylsulfatase A-like enzyme
MTDSETGLLRERVVEAPVDCNLLTKRYTTEAIDYIKTNRDRPFFLYLAHAMPGSIPDAFASEAFKGKSKGGPWGDKVEELDWSTGQILDTLQALGIAKRTFVIWTSDNGAGPIKPEGRGSNFPLAGRGYTTAEAGMRVPCIMWWPGVIPPGTTCGEVATTLDVLPTFAKLAGAPVPADRVIDGKDVRPLILGPPDATSPHTAFFYYFMGQLQAVRSRQWKLYLPLEHKRDSPFRTVGSTPARLFDLKADLSETNDLARERPDVVERLTRCAEQAREDLGDEGRPGKGQRPAGQVDNPTPQVLPERRNDQRSR